LPQPDDAGAEPLLIALAVAMSVLGAGAAALRGLCRD